MVFPAVSMPESQASVCWHPKKDRAVDSVATPTWFEAATTDVSRDWTSEAGIADTSVMLPLHSVNHLFNVDVTSVMPYLRLNPYLPGVLLTMRRRILDYLPGSSFDLELFVDPDEDSEFLVIYVHSSYQAECASAFLKNYLREWLTTTSYDIQRRIAVSLRFADEL